MRSLTLIPVCCVCRRCSINGSWLQIVLENDALVTHGMCPDCYDNAMRELEVSLGIIRHQPRIDEPVVSWH